MCTFNSIDTDMKILTEASPCSSADALLGALIGLGRSVEGNKNRPTDQTHTILLLGLQMLSNPSDFSETDIKDEITCLNEEKYKLVPRCLTCKSQCGRNNDFDPTERNQFTEDMVAVKKEMFHVLISASLAVNTSSRKNLHKALVPLLYDALFTLGSMASLEAHNLCLQRFSAQGFPRI